MPLEQELHTFHGQKEHLLEKYKDRYVLIKGDEVIADFESRSDALREGYKRFGYEAFLVKKVEVIEEVNVLSRALVYNGWSGHVTLAVLSPGVLRPRALHIIEHHVGLPPNP
jgi:hypothetical protein